TGLAGVEAFDDPAGVVRRRLRSGVLHVEPGGVGLTVLAAEVRASAPSQRPGRDDHHQRPQPTSGLLPRGASRLGAWPFFGVRLVADVEVEGEVVGGDAGTAGDAAAVGTAGVAGDAAGAGAASGGSGRPSTSAAWTRFERARSTLGSSRSAST